MGRKESPTVISAAVHNIRIRSSFARCIHLFLIKFDGAIIARLSPVDVS